MRMQPIVRGSPGMRPPPQVRRAPRIAQPGIRPISAEEHEPYQRYPDVVSIFGGGWYDIAAQGASAATVYTVEAFSFRTPYPYYVVGWRMWFYVSNAAAVTPSTEGRGYFLRLGRAIAPFDLSISVTTVEDPFFDLVIGIPGSTEKSEARLWPGKRLAREEMLRAEIQYRRDANAAAVSEGFMARVIVFASPVPHTVEPPFHD